MATAYIWHELYAWHFAGMTPYDRPTSNFMKWMQPIAHVESPESKRRIHSLFEVCRMESQLVRVAPVLAEEDAILRFHTAEYIQKLKKMSANDGGDGGESAPFSPGAWEIARLAAGGVMQGVDAVLSGKVRNAYCLVRPPGHHAERDRGRGFCLINNIAIAAMYAQQSLGVKRIAIIDWDVHHGNGTQQAFYDSDSVLFVSIHQDRQYPQDSGLTTEVGEGKGRGFNFNIPLPPGCGHGAYEAAIKAACAAAEDHKPDLVMVSCGFDPAWTDPLGAMMCHSDTFRMMTKMVKGVAERCCSGKLVVVHEGGYSPHYAPFCALAVVEELSGLKSDAEDPYLKEFRGLGQQELQPHQQQAVDTAVKALADARKPTA